MHKNIFNPYLFKMFKNYSKKLRGEVELKNAQSGFSKFNDAQRRNRKLRNKYCMSGRIW